MVLGIHRPLPPVIIGLVKYIFRGQLHQCLDPQMVKRRWLYGSREWFITSHCGSLSLMLFILELPSWRTGIR